MKTDKIKQAIKINAKLVELGIDINSKDWESFNFKLDEWGNLIIKSGKLDHKPFVSCKNEPLGNSDQLNEILSKLELTFENVQEFAKKMNFDLQKWSNGVNRQYYKLIPDSEWGICKEFKTLQEVVNYLSESK